MLHVGPAGFRSWTCPRALASTDFALSAWRLWRWWEKGQLGRRETLTLPVVEAIDELDAAIASARSAYYDRLEQRAGNRSGGDG